MDFPATSCPVCHKTMVAGASQNLPGFRHLDFATVSKQSSRLQCPCCGLIANPMPYFAQEAHQDYYQSQAYGTSSQTTQTKPNQIGQLLSRSQLQAELLQTAVVQEPRRILDIGCYDGALLHELRRFFPRAELHGIEVNTYATENSPYRDHIHFHTAISNLNGAFDLIIASHSIMCFEHIYDVFRALRGMLSAKGSMAIAAPDFGQNSLAIMLDDLAFHLSKFTMGKIHESLELQTEFLGDTLFRGEFFALGHRSKSIQQENPQALVSLDSLINEIESFGRRIAASRCSFVLGTTLNAAFAHEMLENSLRAFVDENPGKIGKLFRGLPVVSPEQADKSREILLPYGKRSAGLAERLHGKYGLTAVPIE